MSANIEETIAELQKTIEKMDRKISFLLATSTGRSPQPQTETPLDQMSDEELEKFSLDLDEENEKLKVDIEDFEREKPKVISVYWSVSDAIHAFMTNENSEISDEDLDTLVNNIDEFIKQIDDAKSSALGEQEIIEKLLELEAKVLKRSEETTPEILESDFDDFDGDVDFEEEDFEDEVEAGELKEEEM